MQRSLSRERQDYSVCYNASNWEVDDANAPRSAMMDAPPRGDARHRAVINSVGEAEENGADALHLSGLEFTRPTGARGDPPPMTHTREAKPLRGKASVRRFGYLAALSAPWLALLAFLAYISRFLTDDAFISFRYARNLLEGDGLVWNPGERVEGYSNFLWVLELAAIWAATGVPPEDAVWWLSAAYTVATLAAMAWWAWRLPGLRDRGLVWWMALGLLCSSAAFATWTSGGGLETRQFTFFVVLAVVALTAHRGSRRGLLVASLSLALASLTRPEGPLIAACCFAWWAAQEVADGERSGGVRERALEALRRIDWRGALALALPFLLIVGAHFLWRYSYYDEWLPNTYYAKYVRPWWDAGFRYLAAAGVETGLYLLLPLGAGAAWMRWRERRDLAYALPLLIIALHAAYLARIGGDLYDWRPLDFYWPLLALPAADGLARIGRAAGRLLGRWEFGARAADGRLWAVVLFLPVLFYAGAIQGALFPCVAYPTEEAILWRPGWVPPAPGMPALVDLSSKLRGTTWDEQLGHRQIGAFARGQRQKYEAYEDMQRGLIPDDAVALVKSAGVKPYYLPDLTFVDYYGLNDRVIARNPVAHPNSERKVAHDRSPPPGYLEKRGVKFDVFPAALSAGAALSTAPYAVESSPGVWMPFDAPSLEWVEARFDSFVYPGDLHAFAIDNGRLLADSEFDVYETPASDSPISGGRRALAYVREPCAEDDVSARFFLNIYPRRADDLPEEWRTRGYEHEHRRFDFRDRGALLPGACVALFPLPDYPIAGFRTGQRVDGGVDLWRASFSSDPERYRAVHREAALSEPLARGVFDVHLADGALVYVKDPCEQTDTEARFFLHVVPERVSDLPDDRREYGFNGLDFDFFLNGAWFDAQCAARVPLPDYLIVSARTGQHISGEREIWSVELAVGR